tara:strand:+ start:1468 stop:1911 length:444 start_codon:yes stop_codon:yes gene_type:complete
MAKKQKEEKVLDKIVEESKDKKVVFKSDFSEGVDTVPPTTSSGAVNLQDFKSDVEKPEKIEEQELAMIQSMVKTIEQLTNEIGQIEVRKHALMKAMEGVQTRLEGQRAAMQTKYGTDNINLQDGVINYPNPAPQNNPTENGEANKKD